MMTAIARDHERSRSARSRTSSRARSRDENKELTHQALLRAALKLLSQQSFDATSLREVTREAGISPTAFYRHFDDMEELGLELVEEAFAGLRQMIRDARADPEIFDDAVRRSVQVLDLHVRDNTGHMRFIARERYGGVRRIRKAIRRELQLFADELAIDLAVFPVVRDWTADDRRTYAQLIVEIFISMASELLDTPLDRHDEVLARVERQMWMTMIGVAAWQSPAP